MKTTALFRSILLLLLVVCPLATPLPASAEDAVTMEQFFHVAPTDKSAALMSEIFGPEAWNKATEFSNSDDVPGANDATSGGMLGLLSSVLNVACMLITIIIISWGAVSANLSATIDGSAAARHYNVLWVPLRSVFSFGMLLPVIGGYSLIQVLGMKLIFVSIGIANAGYTMVIKDFFAGAPTVPVQVAGVGATARNVFASEVCRLAVVDADGRSMVTMRSATNESIRFKGLLETAFPGAALYRTADTRTDILEISYDGVPGSNLKSAVCGSLKVQQARNPVFEATDSAAQTVFRARVSALNALITDMRGLAAEFVRLSTTSDNRTLPSQTSGKNGLSPDVLDPLISRYLEAQNRYREALVAATAAAVHDLSSAQSMRVIDTVNQDRAKKSFEDWGWIMAGGLYWNMQAFNRSVAELVNKASADALPPALDVLGNPEETDLVNRQYFATIASALSPALDRIQNADGFDTSADGYRRATKFVNTYGATDMNPSYFNGVLAWAKDLMGVNPATNYIVSAMTENGDFVWSLSQLGHFCWNAGVTGVILSGLGSTTDNSKVSAVAAGASKFAGMLIGPLKGAAVLLATMAVPLLITGFFLAFYLPFTPLILWIINVVAWMIQCVKAIMAMPVWAAAHSIPEGEGIAGQHARMGYMLMIGIVLRPLLLFTGLMLGAIILQMAGYLLRFMMPIMFASFDITNAPDFCGFLALLAIFAGLCVSLSLKAFSLSHELADEILTWIGGSATTLGDSADATRTQQLITGGIAGGGARIIGNSLQALTQSREVRKREAINHLKDQGAAKAQQQASHSTAG